MPGPVMLGYVSDEFAGSERFLIRSRLGAGSFGIVYEAHDRKRDAVVALKTLRRATPEALYYLKREFRALADIVHPNLVALHELLTEGPHCFFTMELVRGVDLLTYLRPRSPGGLERSTRGDTPSSAKTIDSEWHGDRHLDESSGSMSDFAGVSAAMHVDADRVRECFRQLARGLAALHDAEKLHRDIKPSNVIVTPDGHVVLLDFGLVADLALSDPGDRRRLEIVGTPPYMSPEQAASGAVTEATDWYAVGVILYQALTGRLPFEGPAQQVLAEKQRRDPTPPRDLVPDVPADLGELCRLLLDRDPARRPKGTDVIAAFERQSPARTPAPAVRSRRFVGRHQEMRDLGNALALMESGRAVMALVHGPSGMGKTAVVRRFLGELSERDRNAAILAGRCYEHESVPYKALDSVVDALSQYLRRLDRAEVEALLPSDVVPLTRLFPVLRRVEAVAAARRRSADIADPRELRRRGFVALRDLFTRLAQQRSVVVWVDDLQWSDLDSVALLEALLRPPDPPPILLIVTYRSDEAATSPALRQLLASCHSEQLGGDIREIPIGELPEADVRDLVQAIVGAGRVDLDAEAALLKREAGGNPLFICELLRHVDEIAPAATRTLSLESVVQTRVQKLPEAGARLLAVIALAGRPLKFDVARTAAEVGSAGYALVSRLRSDHLVRLRDSETGQQVETYHDRIRNTVVAALPAETAQHLHLRLAVAVETDPPIDPEALAFHLRAAGDRTRAAEYAIVAAGQAAEALAFDRAARLYREGLELTTLSNDERRRIRIRLASALANAGRGAQAGREYLAAAEGAPPIEFLDLRRRGAEQLLMSGHIDEGLTVLTDLLQRTRLKLAPSASRALVRLIARQVYIRARGLRFRERSEGQIPAAELVRLDTCWSVAVGLGLVETIRAAELQSRHLLLALKTGEPYRVARALAVEAAYSALRGHHGRRHTEKILEASMTLAERLNHPHALGLATLTAGIAANLEQRWKHSLELCERAEIILRERCTGVAWELDTAEHNLMRNRLYLGRWRELSLRVPALLKDAKERGDLYLRTGTIIRDSYIPRLCADEPEIATVEVREALDAWSQQGFHLEHYWALVVLPEIELYRGEPETALSILDSQWPALKASRFLSIESAITEMIYVKARVSLAAAIAAQGVPSKRQIHLQTADRDIRRLERQRIPVADAVSSLLRGGLAATQGRVEQAVAAWTVAEQRLESADMPLHAAAARWARGRLLGAAQGRALVSEADALMAREGIRVPARVVSLLCPYPAERF